MTFTIAVIGNGNMGSPMAINLAKAGFRVSAYDLVAAKTATLIPNSVRAASSHRDAICNADFVLTMLPTGSEVLQVYRDEVFGHVPDGCILIDSSTIDLGDAQTIHREAARQGHAMLDAPVSGGTGGAAAATLTFMIGGDQSILERSRPVFDILGDRIIHCGEGGMGQAAKMCNNMMLGIQMASVAEGFRLSRKVGLGDRKLYEVASSSSSNCFSLTAFCPVPGVVDQCPANNDYKPGFQPT